ncbi:MAG: hypothetical protein V3T83_19565, partial [Acidobacteriota bacterium]
RSIALSYSGRESNDIVKTMASLAQSRFLVGYAAGPGRIQDREKEDGASFLAGPIRGSYPCCVDTDDRADSYCSSLL